MFQLKSSGRSHSNPALKFHLDEVTPRTDLNNSKFVSNWDSGEPGAKLSINGVPQPNVILRGHVRRIDGTDPRTRIVIWYDANGSDFPAPGPQTDPTTGMLTITLTNDPYNEPADLFEPIATTTPPPEVAPTSPATVDIPVQIVS